MAPLSALIIIVGTVRAVFSRKANGQYTYWGLIEHDKGVGNGFHKCP
jgi:hypothetical protein